MYTFMTLKKHSIDNQMLFKTIILWLYVLQVKLLQLKGIQEMFLIAVGLKKASTVCWK